MGLKTSISPENPTIIITHAGNSTAAYRVPFPCNVNITSPVPIDQVPGFPGLLALGPTMKEREILIQCCGWVDTVVLPHNGKDCLRVAKCPVTECTMRDPAVRCVEIVREQWGVEGVNGCLAGSKVSKASRKPGKGLKRWVMIGVILGIVGTGGL